MIETALAAVQQTRATWTAPDLTRAISNALPDDLGRLSPEQVTELLDGLTKRALELAVPLDAERPGHAALPDELRLANGRSAYQSPGAQRYATPAHLHTERLLSVAAAVRRDAPALPRPVVDAFTGGLAEQGVELGVDQATPEGEQYGDRMTLPASYVAEHVALGYASTVHAAQGVTVDTSHAVVTSHTGPEGLYVGIRGAGRPTPPTSSPAPSTRTQSRVS